MPSWDLRSVLDPLPRPAGSTSLMEIWRQFATAEAYAGIRGIYARNMENIWQTYGRGGTKGQQDNNMRTRRRRDDETTGPKGRDASRLVSPIFYLPSANSSWALSTAPLR